MRNFFERLKYSVARWMYGRNGMDRLNQILLILAIVLNLLSSIFESAVLYLLACALIIWCVFRFCSKNLYKRRQENAKIEGLWQKVLRDKETYKKMWNERHTHLYFKCKCGTRLRVPKGKGKIEIICPKCKTKIIKKT